MSPYSDNPELALAYDMVSTTGRHLFLTGKAGTGKTTFLKSIRESLPKRMVVCAPTGVAAINAGGVTLHSFFQLPFGPRPSGGGEGAEPSAVRFRMGREKIAMIRGMDLLVIDEISMVRADLLDAVDEVLRRYRDADRPFGGVQLLMIGDLHQLPPVAKDEEWSLLQTVYDTPYFFSSHALAQTEFRCVELTRVYRQQEGAFLDILNAVRDNRLSAPLSERLNQRLQPGFQPADGESYITLCTHNAQAARLNEARLAALPGRPRGFTAEIGGHFPETAFPMESRLALKPGAQVMFVKNDPEKRFHNGKMGCVTRIETASVTVHCPDDDTDITVGPMSWNNVKYAVDADSGRIAETVEGTFTQIPLRPAWAITIHKSQGLTFDRAIIDAGAAFAPGQVYVALSRCRTLEGLVLRTPIRTESLRVDPPVSAFHQRLASARPNASTLRADQLAFQRDLLEDLFRFDRLSIHAHLLRRAILENASTLPASLADAANAVATAVRTSLSGVALQFLPQFHRLLAENPDAEQNEALRERLQKASGWFGTHLREEIEIPVSLMDLDVDNQALRKQLLAARDRLNAEIRLKSACFAVLLAQEGFRTVAYLEARARAILGAVPGSGAGSTATVRRTRKNPITAVLEEAHDAHPILLARLRAWRTKKAAANKCPAYFIFSQKTLHALAMQLPRDLLSLSAVYGLGTSKIARYGTEILAVIQTYLDEKETPTPAPDDDATPPSA